MKVYEKRQDLIKEMFTRVQKNCLNINNDIQQQNLIDQDDVEPSLGF